MRLFINGMQLQGFPLTSIHIAWVRHMLFLRKAWATPLSCSESHELISKLNTPIGDIPQSTLSPIWHFMPLLVPSFPCASSPCGVYQPFCPAPFVLLFLICNLLPTIICNLASHTNCMGRMYMWNTYAPSIHIDNFPLAPQVWSLLALAQMRNVFTA